MARFLAINMPIPKRLPKKQQPQETIIIRANVGNWIPFESGEVGESECVTGTYMYKDADHEGKWCNDWNAKGTGIFEYKCINDWPYYMITKCPNGCISGGNGKDNCNAATPARTLNLIDTCEQNEDCLRKSRETKIKQRCFSKICRDVNCTTSRDCNSIQDMLYPKYACINKKCQEYTSKSDYACNQYFKPSGAPSAANYKLINIAEGQCFTINVPCNGDSICKNLNINTIIKSWPRCVDGFCKEGLVFRNLLCKGKTGKAYKCAVTSSRASDNLFIQPD